MTDIVAPSSPGAKSPTAWTDWLAQIGYGIDYADKAPPCTRRELAEAYMRANPDSGHDVETWEWCIEQNTGASFAGDA